MLMTSDQDTYNHNRSVYGKDHDYMIRELQVSPKCADVLKAMYDMELVRIRKTVKYRQYYELRKRMNYTPEMAKKEVGLIGYEPEKFENIYKEDEA